MIRNVVTGRLRAGLSEDERVAVDRALAGIAGLQLPGLVSMSAGYDLGLREGGWTLAIVNDWVDAEAYRHYDLDAEHNEYRAVIAGACEALSRVQFEHQSS